jgi:hypothetical protein
MEAKRDSLIDYFSVVGLPKDAHIPLESKLATVLIKCAETRAIQDCEIVILENEKISLLRQQTWGLRSELS